jgi:hypothetical protein
MYPIHDSDVLLLLAVALSSKRRPAELVEIVAAADLIQGSLPLEEKLFDAFHRLAGCGLLGAVVGGFTLTPAAQVSGYKQKASVVDRFHGTREKLADYQPSGEHAPIELTTEQLGAAFHAHRTAAKAAVQNLLAPKPKVAEGSNKRYDQKRKFGSPPRRKG